jgi:hypothetical protein
VAAAGAASGSSCGPLAAAAATAAGRRAFSVLSRPSLFQKKRVFTPEDAAFWGILGINVAVAVAARADDPGIREAVMTHCGASIPGLAAGRAYTLATCLVTHYSGVQCAINMGLLALFRRVHQLSARQVGPEQGAGSQAGG